MCAWCRCLRRLAWPQAPNRHRGTANGDPVTTDRDGRVRIQFPWQRGPAPINGGLTGPNTVGAQPTGHAG